MISASFLEMYFYHIILPKIKRNFYTHYQISGILEIMMNKGCVACEEKYV